MPSKYIIRDFAEDNFYHIFNRGIEERDIFVDEKDFHIFLYYIFIYLSPLEVVLKKYPQLPLKFYARNLSTKINLICYCLMPNHFHLLLYQNDKSAISMLMRQLGDAYTRYFNTERKRKGNLFSGRFKAVKIESGEQLTHLSRYIHLNPAVACLCKDPKEYLWSSYNFYLGNADNSFCRKEDILTNFSTIKGYEQFVLDHLDYARKIDAIKHLAVDFTP